MEYSLNKIVFIGWSAFIASLADGIKRRHPQCLVYCVESPLEYIDQGVKEGYFDPLPSLKADIFEDADFVLIAQDEKEYLQTLENIKSYLSENTHIMDFQMVKSETHLKASNIISESQIISTYVFLDHYPSTNMIRADFFYGKIVAVICDDRVETLQKVRDFWNIVQVKIVPTTSEFFDEIVAQTKQSLTLISSMYANILKNDGWSDTLFFGFYNKQLQNLLALTSSQEPQPTYNMIKNMDNIRRMLTFFKREIEKLDQWIDDEEQGKLDEYFKNAQDFSKRI